MDILYENHQVLVLAALLKVGIVVLILVSMHQSIKISSTITRLTELVHRFQFKADIYISIYTKIPLSLAVILKIGIIY